MELIDKEFLYNYINDQYENQQKIIKLEYQLALKSLLLQETKEQNEIILKSKERLIYSLQKDLQKQLEIITKLERQITIKMDTIQKLFEENCKLEEQIEKLTI